MADEELPVIARFEVRRRSYLAPDGTVLRPLPNFASDSDILISLYRGMVLTRAFDLKAVSLQRTGRLGTYAVSLGQEAVSVPLQLQTASQTLAQKAIAAGFSGEQVDGNDVVAVRAAAEDAIAQARAGGGPRLIEAVTYRLSDHTTADDAARYRPPEEVQARWKEEPIARLRAYLVSQKAWGKAQEEELATECQKEIEAAIERYLASSPRAPETMFDHLYAELPRSYASQRAELSGGSDA